ncbi:hypothetical protein EGW08_023708, partial [Elysia chlorotica]
MPFDNISGPQKLIPTLDPNPQVNAVIGMSAEFGVQIYGYPEPSSLSLQAVNDATDLSSSSRHTVVYTAALAPFGTVNVTISDLVTSDFTNYTLTVDNGEGKPLVYSFYLNEVNAPESPCENQDSEGGSLNTVAVVIGVVAMVVIAGSVIFVAILLKKIRRLRKKLDASLKDSSLDNGDTQGNGTYLSPVYIPEIEDSEFVSASQPQRQGQYETVDDLPASRDIIPVSASQLPGSRQYETVDDLTASRDIIPVSASQLPGSRQYETVDDLPASRDIIPVSSTNPPRTRQYETVYDTPPTRDALPVSA